ncbi:MAG: DUF3795 domain-containing protein [Candidatus Cloacimonadaceae bacterium]|nr:DUF3795 domain-containing protein [Candidatus Cloacimonadaceae bacterium]MDP3114823.1 DUF3795 domain-containing protein [Candidatus Cloacimonadaceae bacterium]
MRPHYAPCGIDCTVCSVYQATLADDSEARIALAEKYKTGFDKDIDPESIVCDGCLGSGKHLGFCSVCQIRSCALQKGFRTCAECPDLPCEKGQRIWQENSISMANLLQIREADQS